MGVHTNEELAEQNAVNHALAKRDFEDLKREVQELKASVDGLVNAWNTATSVIVFVKWVAAAVTAGIGLWLLFKGKLSL